VITDNLQAGYAQAPEPEAVQPNGTRNLRGHRVAVELNLESARILGEDARARLDPGIAGAKRSGA
jgi:hypothetical protein